MYVINSEHMDSIHMETCAWQNIVVLCSGRQINRRKAWEYSWDSKLQKENLRVGFKGRLHRGRKAG